MTSVIEIDPRVPVEEYLMENAIVTTAWLFGDKYGIPLWQNIVMKTLRPVPELSCRLENTQPKSPLRYFIVYKILQQMNHGKRKLLDFSVLNT